MDLFFNIIFYGILALIPISLILVFAFSKTKLVREMATNTKKRNHNPAWINEDISYSDWRDNPSFSSLSGNIYHNDLFDEK